MEYPDQKAQADLYRRIREYQKEYNVPNKVMMNLLNEEIKDALKSAPPVDEE